MEPKQNSFWTNFGAEMDPEMEPEMETWPEMEPKYVKNAAYVQGSGKCKYCKLQVQVPVQIMSDE